MHTIWEWARAADGDEPVFVAGMRERVNDDGIATPEFLVYDGAQWGWCHPSQIAPPPSPAWATEAKMHDGKPCECDAEPIGVTPAGFDGEKWLCPNCGVNWTTPD